MVDRKELLFQLQQVDITWTKVQRRLVRLQQLTYGQEKLAEARQELEEREAELQRLQGARADAELEIRSLDERIAEADRRLMSGTITNPKELENLEASIGAMRRQRNMIADRTAEILRQVDELTETVARLQEMLARLEEECETRRQSRDEELLQRKKEYVYLKKLRTELASRLPSNLLEEYEQLRKRKRGVAVARLQEDVCGVCNMQVPVGLVGTVRYGDDLIYCPSCGRILVAF